MQVIGPHAVTCGSLTGGQVNDLFDAGQKADLMFGDPPWGEGNVKFWATKASKDTGVPVAPISYEALISRWFELAQRFVDDHVFIETGLRWHQDSIERMQAIGLRKIQSVELLYASGGRKLPNVLIHGSFKGNEVSIRDLHHLSGAQVSRLTIAKVARPGGIVFDPCCGMGYSAQAAIDNGMTFRGNELNPVRLKKTVARLERATK